MVQIVGNGYSWIKVSYGELSGTSIMLIVVVYF